MLTYDTTLKENTHTHTHTHTHWVWQAIIGWYLTWHACMFNNISKIWKYYGLKIQKMW
jgi:hypothetical protein